MADNGNPRPWWMPVLRGRVPLWLKVVYTLFIVVLVPTYWRHYGPANFLWASDIALLLVFAAVWLESKLLNGMMTIGVLPFELAWTVDLLAGAGLVGMAHYMFDPALPLYLRGLSLYHVALPAVMVFLLLRLGYDRRALVAQTLLVWIVLPATYLLTDPALNINLVFGFGREPQTAIPPLAHLALEMVLVPTLVCLPMHLLVRRVVGRR